MYPGRTCCIERSEDGRCFARMPGDRERQEIPRALAWFLSQLDGKTDPHTILPDFSPRQIRKLISMLEEKEYVTTKRWTFSLFPLQCKRYFAPGRASVAVRRWCLLASGALLLLCIPMLMIGLRRFFALDMTDGGSTLLGYILGTVVGLLLHEAAHALSCIGFNGYCFYSGVMMQMFVLPCAFIEIDYVRLPRAARIQTTMAGVEMNFLLAGLAFCLMPVCFGDFWLSAGLSSLFLGLLNLGIYYVGLDGAKALSELLGTDVSLSLDILSKYSVRRAIRKKAGATGRARIAVARVLSLLQIGVVTVLILNLREVFS